MRPVKLAPGIAVLVLIAFGGRLVAATVGLNHLIAAIFLGALIGNIVNMPDRFAAGVASHTLCLEAGIVIVGASIALERVVMAGPLVLSLVLGVVVGTLLVVELLSRLLDIAPKLGSLLASGASICGVSAVVSVAGSIDADESSIAYASATILLFDALTLVVYPLVGSLLNLSDFAYGVWAGATMFSTGPVTAAGFAHSTVAGQWATLTKLTRNALLGAVTFGYVLLYTRDTSTSVRQSLSFRENAGLWQDFPKFLIGFGIMLVLGNTVFTHSMLQALEHASDWLFLLAFAGLGLELKADTLRSSGLTPLIVVLVSFLIFSSLVLGLVVVLL